MDNQQQQNPQPAQPIAIPSAQQPAQPAAALQPAAPAPAQQVAPKPAAPPATPQPAPAAPAQPPAPVAAPKPAVPPAQPAAPKPAAAAPAPAPALSATKPAPAPAQAGSKPLAANLPKDQAKSNKKVVVGCLSAFGCSLLLFIGILFSFLAFGDTSNPIFGFLGVPPGEVVNVLITLINLIFLVLVFISFVLVIIGVFKISAAKKEDKEAKRGGTMLTFASLSVMVVLIFLWVVAYLFLAPKRTADVIRVPIITTPEKTTNLTAPIIIKFDASKSPIDKAKFEVLSYGWDFGDGAKAIGVTQTHTYTELGNFKAKLTITLRDIAANKETAKEFTRDVTIQNVLANVVIKADKKKGPAPLTVGLDGSESSSPNGEITAYAWDLDADSAFDDGTEASAQTTFDKIGIYKVSLRVTDSTGAFATGDIEIEATASDNPAPVITVEGVEGAELETNKAYVFSAAQSATPAGTIEKYDWEFGDGAKANTRTATHTYKDAGEYDVVLKITDSAKKTAETTNRYSIKPPSAAPLPSIKTTPEAVNGILKGRAPFEVIFDASGSKDPNDNIVEYAWDFDGDSKTDDANPTTARRFMAAGVYSITLTVTDSTNLSAKTQITMQVEAAGLKADIKADPIAGVVPLTVKFDASGSSYPEGSIVAYEWDFGDGGAPRVDAATVSHQYTAVGTFTVKVTAITSDNKRATAQVPVSVRPVALKACFEPSASSGKSPLEVQFDPTCSTGTVMKYNWNFAGLGRSSDRKPKFTFRDAGEYDVSLEVADSQNTVDTFTSKITIEAP